MSEKYIRDRSNPGAILNTDNDALQAYKSRKKREKDVDQLKEEVRELKTLIQILINKIQ